MEDTIDIGRIIEGCINKDETCQLQLYKVYSQRFYRFCRRLCRNDSETKDVFVTSFATILNNIDRYQNKGSFEGWMYRILVRTIKKNYRRTRYHHVQLVAEVGDVKDSTSCSMDERLALKDVFDVVLQKLSVKDRMLFSLIAIEGYDQTEAADIMRMSVSTVQRKYKQIRKTLQKELKKFGIEE